MLTETQRKTFSEILDINWELKEENKKVQMLAHKLAQKKDELKESMGEAQYNHFIKIGQQMFAPKAD